MTGDQQSRDAAAGVAPRRHWAGFIASGLLALGADVAVIEAGVRLFGWSPYLARPFAISVAMVVGWLAHRRLTFALTAPPSVAEFARYAAAAWLAAAVNCLAFAILLVLWPGMQPSIGVTAASLFAMVFSYLSMRYAVFRKPGRG